MNFNKKIICLIIGVLFGSFSFAKEGNESSIRKLSKVTLQNAKDKKPNIILVMADDQGWGQTGYYNHPVLKTPNLDDMAKSGLRFDRFYAGAPLCSPTRASVLTGRSNDRTAVLSHGYAMRKQEKTIAQALKKAGYKTAHFGKWHLDGLQGPGVPIFKGDERGPGKFGFDEWLSTTNFFDINPIMSRNGSFEEIQGESSRIIVKEALRFIEKEKDNGSPLFIVIWYGSPHSPWLAEDSSKKDFKGLEASVQEHYGELVAMDESIGKLRKGLKTMNIADNTLVWFNSDNGGLSSFGPETVGGLRGFKGTMYEGGLRVPAIIEWPSIIKNVRVTKYPAVTMDIFPTIADIVGLPSSCMTNPVDGISLKKIFQEDIKTRKKAIPFRMEGKGALVDTDYKLVVLDIAKNRFELYNLKTDKNESEDIIENEPEIARKMIKEYAKWNQSVVKSIEGDDFKGGLSEPDPGRIRWDKVPAYQPYIENWNNRPEYKKWLKIDNLNK